MTAEKIIERIKKDAEKEIKQILKEAEKQASDIVNNARKEAEREAEKILADGKKESENIRRILISKANQDVKHKIMKAKEELIEECFIKAHQKLSSLDEKKYVDIVTKLMEEGRRKLDENCVVVVSRDSDKKIAEKLKLNVVGTIESTGGIILKSENGKITLDNTFDGILKRKKSETRIKVGKLLFS